MASDPNPIDRERLREKYREERDKRVRPDGKDQYVQPIGRFAHMLEDPYVERTERPAVVDDVTVAILGGGFGGLVTGARLKQAGVQDVRVIEGGGDFGGAWYWNRYPGAMCDTAAMIYLPLLEETGYAPTLKYALAPEIFEHARRIARHFGLYDNALLSTRVTAVAWDGAASRWIVRTDRGDVVRARFVAIGTGPLHLPAGPARVRRREDGGPAGSRRRRGGRPRDGRPAQALVPPALQAAVFPRRVPPGVQRSVVPLGRHGRQRRRADRRGGRVGLRPALPSRLSDLRFRVRGRHASRPPLGLRGE